MMMTLNILPLCDENAELRQPVPFDFDRLGLDLAPEHALETSSLSDVACRNWKMNATVLRGSLRGTARVTDGSSVLGTFVKPDDVIPSIDIAFDIPIEEEMEILPNVVQPDFNIIAHNSPIHFGGYPGGDGTIQVPGEFYHPSVFIPDTATNAVRIRARAFVFITMRPYAIKKGGNYYAAINIRTDVLIDAEGGVPPFEGSSIAQGGEFVGDSNGNFPRPSESAPAVGTARFIDETRNRTWGELTLYAEFFGGNTQTLEIVWKNRFLATPP